METQELLIATDSVQAKIGQSQKLSYFWSFLWIVGLCLSPPSYSSISWSQNLVTGIALSLFLLGFLLRCFSRAFDKWGENLIIRGLFRYVRNPLEIGKLFYLLGAIMLINTALHWQIALGIGAFCFLSYEHYARELRLLRRFGPSYIKYRERVPRWIPLSVPGANRSQHGFSFLKGLGRELKSLSWIPIFIIAYAIRVRLYGTDSLLLNLIWN